MRRRPIAEQKSDLPRGGVFDEMYWAGCLVTLGVVGLLPLLLIMWVITSESLQSAWNAIDWTGPLEFVQSVWRWMRRGSPDTRIISVISIFAFGYFVLIWQWIVFVLGCRTLLAPSRLWAVSSGYFIAAITIFVVGVHSTRPASHGWLFTIAVCMVPAIFLAVTLPLWLLTTRHVNEPSRPRKSPGACA